MKKLCQMGEKRKQSATPLQSRWTISCCGCDKSLHVAFGRVNGGQMAMTNKQWSVVRPCVVLVLGSLIVVGQRYGLVSILWLSLAWN
jgi:hypothetical protein